MLARPEREEQPVPHKDELAKHRKRERQAELAKFLGRVGQRYAECELTSFEVTHPNKQTLVLSQVNDYARHLQARLSAGEGLLLYGATGTGKDHLLISVGRHAIMLGWKIYWCNGADLFGAMRDRIGTSEPEHAVLRRYTTPPILYISDLCPTSGHLKEYQADTLYRIIDRRNRDMRPTWVSLNVASAKEADERIGAPIVDRLKHDALVLYCDWPSYRTPSNRRE